MDKAKHFVKRSQRDMAMFHYFMDMPKPDAFAALQAMQEHSAAQKAFWAVVDSLVFMPSFRIGARAFLHPEENV